MLLLSTLEIFFDIFFGGKQGAELKQQGTFSKLLYTRMTRKFLLKQKNKFDTMQC